MITVRPYDEADYEQMAEVVQTRKGVANWKAYISKRLVIIDPNRDEWLFLPQRHCYKKHLSEPEVTLSLDELAQYCYDEEWP